MLTSCKYGGMSAFFYTHVIAMDYPLTGKYEGRFISG
ncbi:hypothetical protein O23A_p2671 [Aeromonas salmonicida]|nr:hypothetical protein O23A_p2671 [Aeromonas salmonicida]